MGCKHKRVGLVFVMHKLHYKITFRPFTSNPEVIRDVDAKENRNSVVLHQCCSLAIQS